MIYIVEEDVSKILPTLIQVLKSLGTGIKRLDAEASVGDDVTVANITGYWISDMIRIDIKFKEVDETRAVQIL